MKPPRTFELELQYSDQGCGLFVPQAGARVLMEVHANGPPESIHEIVLQGDCEGLRALAAAIIATVESPVPGYHLHIDEEVNGPVFRSPQGFTLTISRFEK